MSLNYHHYLKVARVGGIAGHKSLKWQGWVALQFTSPKSYKGGWHCRSQVLKVARMGGIAGHKSLK